MIQFDLLIRNLIFTIEKLEKITINKMALERKTFTYEAITLSFYMIEDLKSGNIWMSGSSLAESLGYKLPNKAILMHVNENNKLSWAQFDTSFGTSLKTPPNWQPTTIMINEAGLNQLIMRSKLPNVKLFQEWVCSVVLPSLGNTMDKFSNWVAEKIIFFNIIC